MAGYAVGSYVEAQLSPKIGYRGAGLLGLILMAIGTIGIPMAKSYNLILLFRFMQGWGILWLVGVNSSVAWFPAKQRGLASGVIGGGLTLGIGAGGVVANALINAAGTWQGAFRTWGIIIAVMTVCYGILMKEPPKDLYPEDVVEKGPESAEKINPFKTAACWLCIFILFFNCRSGGHRGPARRPYRRGVHSHWRHDLGQSRQERTGSSEGTCIYYRHTRIHDRGSCDIVLPVPG